jgi:hypothetical protein
MTHRKRSAGWLGWVVAVLAVLAIPGLVAGILVVNRSSFLPSSRPAPAPRIVGKNCGTITAGMRGTAGDFAASEQCLWTAYQTCQTATLVYHFVGLDNTLTHAVSVQPHGASCTVTDATLSVVDAGPSLQTARNSYQCRGMQQQASGLVILGCSAEGDITIPASPRLALAVGAPLNR